jgi:hypothetical protein
MLGGPAVNDVGAYSHLGDDQGSAVEARGRGGTGRDRMVQTAGWDVQHAARISEWAGRIPLTLTRFIKTRGGGIATRSPAIATAGHRA